MNAPSRNDDARRLAADAAALVRVASPRDWPGGFVVVPERLPPNIVGLACGSGDGVAKLYGYRPGTLAVLVDVWKRVGNVAAPTRDELAKVESIALHEAAHALTGSTATAERVDALLSTAGADVAAYSAERVAMHHCPRWAMAFWLLTTRGVAFRPRTGAAMRAHVVGQLEQYGYQADDLEALARGVDPDVSLADGLRVGGAWDTLLSARLPNIEQRTNAIVAAGVARERKG